MHSPRCCLLLACWAGGCSGPALEVSSGPRQELLVAGPMQGQDDGADRRLQLQEIVAWTPPSFQSSFADTVAYGHRYCFDPATEELWSWQGDRGCRAPRARDFLDAMETFIVAHPEWQFLVSLNVNFPDGTFVDRNMVGQSVVYRSSLDGLAGHEIPMHAYNLHAPATQALFERAYRAILRRCAAFPHVIGYVIGYNIYQENLVGSFGFTRDSFARFGDLWREELHDKSALDPKTLADIDGRVADLVATPDDPGAWPRPVVAPTGVYVETPASRAQRFFYAYFQKFRQRDLAAFHQRLFDTVKQVAGDEAWVTMHNAQIYTKVALPSPIEGSRFIQGGELPMLPVIDPRAYTIGAWGKDEGMDLHGYSIARCRAPNLCDASAHPPYGVCPSTRPDSSLCVCEPVENGCVDDWRLDRTVAYLRRSRAHGLFHRANAGFIRSGFRVVGGDWEEDPSVQIADFQTLDYLTFNDYALPGERSWAAQLRHDTPIQVHLYYPVWVQGSVPQVQPVPGPYHPQRVDGDYLTNLLESRGVAWEPAYEDWSTFKGKIIVPYHDLIAPLLTEIPGYAPDRIIPVNTLPVAAPNPVDLAFADDLMKYLVDQAALTPSLARNPLERLDPTNAWEPWWIMKVGAFQNVVYNLSDHVRCVTGTDGGQRRLAPFQVRFLTDAVDETCPGEASPARLPP